MDLMDAVGTIITDRPPAQNRTGASTHTAPTLVEWRGTSRTPLNPWDTRCPALCRPYVGLNDVLPGPRPFLPSLRRRLLFFVRLIHRYYGAVRLLQNMRVRRVAWGLRGPASFPVWVEAFHRSPGSRASCFSACAGSPTTQDRLLARVYR
jgi:hypothetical protein